jgi:hypothetical protein
MASSTVVWVGVYVALGILVGVPVERFLNQVQKLALQGAILVVMGIGCYIAIRKTPASSGAGLVRVPRWVRVVLAAALDVGVVASVTRACLPWDAYLAWGSGPAGWMRWSYCWLWAPSMSSSRGEAAARRWGRSCCRPAISPVNACP